MILNVQYKGGFKLIFKRTFLSRIFLYCGNFIFFKNQSPNSIAPRRWQTHPQKNLPKKKIDVRIRITIMAAELIRPAIKEGTPTIAVLPQTGHLNRYQPDMWNIM